MELSSGGIQQLIKFIPDVSAVKRSLTLIQKTIDSINTSMKFVSPSLVAYSKTNTELQKQISLLEKINLLNKKNEQSISNTKELTSARIASIQTLTGAKLSESGAKISIMNESSSLKNVLTEEKINTEMRKRIAISQKTQDLNLRSSSLVHLTEAKINTEKERANLLATRQEYIQQKIDKKLKDQEMSLGRIMTKMSYFWIKSVVLYNAMNTLFSPIIRAERGETVISNILPSYGVTDLKDRVSLSKKYLKDLMDYGTSIGADISRVAEPYSQFMATRINTLSFEQQDAVAKSFLKFGAAMQIDSNKIEGMFTAIGQMASKGKVSMEELRKQLTNAIPNAMPMAAESVGMSMKQLEQAVSSGTISVEYLLTSMSKHIETTFKDFKKPDTLVQAMTDLRNAFTNLMMSLKDSGLIKMLTMMINVVAKIVTALKPLMPLITTLAAAFAINFAVNRISAFGLALKGNLFTMKAMVLELLKIKVLSSSLSTGDAAIMNTLMGRSNAVKVLSSSLPTGDAAIMNTLMGKSSAVSATSSVMSAFNRYAGIAVLAGAGLNAVGNMVSDINNPSENKTRAFAGSAARVLGSTAQWAGSGAMLGGLVGPVGAAVGAAIGGLGGGIYQVYNEIKAGNEYQKNKDIIKKNSEVKITLGMDINNRANSELSFNKPTVSGGFSDFNFSGFYTGNQAR